MPGTLFPLVSYLQRPSEAARAWRCWVAYGSAIRRSVSLRILFGKAMVAKIVMVRWCGILRYEVEARVCSRRVTQSGMVGYSLSRQRVSRRLTRLDSQGMW